MMTRPSVCKIAVFSLCLFLLLPLKTLYAVKAYRFQTKDAIVFFQEPLRSAAEETAHIYPAVKDRLEDILGWKINFIPTVLLIKDSKTFQRMARSIYIVAFAIPQKNLIVIDYSKMRTHPFSIEVTLKHELCHLLLNHYIKRENLPKWLNEGIAQWVSGGIGELIMNGDRSILDGAILSGKPINIRALQDRFPEDRKSLILAYEASKSLVEYIINKYSKDGILKILRYLKDGDKPDVAIMKGLSISVDELGKEWYDYHKRKIPWFTYITSNLYGILFFLSALILIYGFIRRRMKKRVYENEEDEYMKEQYR
jgi:hypothetical protein